MERRYTALKMVSIIYKIQAIGIAALAVILAGLSVAGSLIGGILLRGLDERAGFLAAGGIVVGIVYAVLLIFAGTLLALPLYAFGQIIDLFIDIEMNTRTTTALFYQWMQPPVPMPAPPIERVAQN